MGTAQGKRRLVFEMTIYQRFCGKALRLPRQCLETFIAKCPFLPNLGVRLKF
jgi:hypothetical protein